MTDRYPNYISGQLTQTSNNTFITQRVTSPVQRTGQGRRGRATVMEILYIWVDLSGTRLDASEDVLVAFSGGPTPGGIDSIKDPNTIVTLRIVSSLVTSGLMHLKTPIKLDLQDANGFGQLFAGDGINVELDSSGSTATWTVNYRIFYRFVDVPIEEYIGILQSVEG